LNTAPARLGLRRGEQDDLGAPAACQVDHAFQVGDGLALRLLAQHVVAAEAEQHQLRLVLIEQPRQAFEALRAGVAADTAIDHRPAGFLAQQHGPGLLRLHAVGCGEAVTQGQHLGPGGQGVLLAAATAGGERQ
jgi:hypothetical protein